MADVESLISEAFAELERFPGFSPRPDQRQLALLLSDCMADGKSGAFEAPTGLGKSLATLVPAIAHAIASGKRTVVATYTNVLAEQYWRKDLPLALSLFEGYDRPRAQFLIGRQRYACVAAMAEISPTHTKEFRHAAQLGIESELRDTSRKFGRELTDLWQKISAPPVCPARLCSHYSNCYYYNARNRAEKAQVVITNHSVVLQDAVLKKASDGELGMLGEYDFLVLDEAHDFAQAALNALEFELSEDRLGILAGIVQRMQSSLAPLALESGQPHLLNDLCDSFRRCITAEQQQLKSRTAHIGQGILNATPLVLQSHPQVKMRTVASEVMPDAERIAQEIALMCLELIKGIEHLLQDWKRSGAITGTQAEDAIDSIRNYCMFIREFAYGCHHLCAAGADTEGEIGVTYVTSGTQRSTQIRHDVIGLADPLRELIWNAVPTASISATLAVDGNFDFYRRMTGAEPAFEEILPSPFDFGTQAALYLPKKGSIPDPTTARKQGTEEQYFDAVARELSEIIRAVSGRTLALFHSRKEMEAVYDRINLPSEFPIYVQRGSSAGWVGEKFKNETQASLFALRSFWTGFDAPGETLSCVALVRVPFEVPVDPAQIARMAWLQTQGHDPFAAYSLPQAKMLIRQGAGRLIRTVDDVGVIALLDPRVRTKNYGDEILANLPDGVRTYEDIQEALAAVGLTAGLQDAALPL